MLNLPLARLFFIHTVLMLMLLGTGRQFVWAPVEVQLLTVWLCLGRTKSAVRCAVFSVLLVLIWGLAERSNWYRSTAECPQAANLYLAAILGLHTTVIAAALRIARLNGVQLQRTDQRDPVAGATTSAAPSGRFSFPLEQLSLAAGILGLVLAAICTLPNLFNTPQFYFRTTMLHVWMIVLTLSALAATLTPGRLIWPAVLLVGLAPALESLLFVFELWSGWLNEPGAVALGGLTRWCIETLLLLEHLVLIAGNLLMVRALGYRFVSCSA